VADLEQAIERVSRATDGGARTGAGGD
jgi:hypothetical protein